MIMLKNTPITEALAIEAKLRVPCSKATCDCDIEVKNTAIDKLATPNI